MEELRLIDKIINKIGDLLDQNEIFKAETMIMNLETSGLSKKQIDEVRLSYTTMCHHLAERN